MLIKFSSEQSAGFVMLDSTADQLLAMMGHGGNTEGSVSGEALADALERLESALAREQDEPTDDGLRAQEDDNNSDNEEDEDGDEPKAVTLPARAAPLIAMLRRAKKDVEGYVMWRPD